jgi:hypothetical protein
MPIMTRRIFFLLLSFSLAGAAWAKPQDKQDKDDYTRLARLSYIEGNVSYQHATDVDWAAASINLPLEPGFTRAPTVELKSNLTMAPCIGWHGTQTSKFFR